MNNTEKLIKFLNGKYTTSNTNTIYIHRNELNEIGLSESETIKTIQLLKTDDLLEINKISIHNDLSIPCIVTLKSACVHYFENKAVINAENRRGWISSYGAVILSAIAIIISIISLILD